MRGGEECSFLAGYLSQPGAGSGSLRDTSCFMASPQGRLGVSNRTRGALFPKDRDQEVSSPKQHELGRHTSEAKGCVSPRKSWECCQMLQ